jgi:hypothetical protein
MTASLATFPNTRIGAQAENRNKAKLARNEKLRALANAYQIDIASPEYGPEIYFVGVRARFRRAMNKPARTMTTEAGITASK